MNPFKFMAAWAISLSILGGGIWGIYYGISNQQRGIYAGNDYFQTTVDR